MNAKNILHNANLSTGACREQIIEMLLKSNTAISEQDIRNKLDDSFDRSSIYRTFKTLLDKDIIHAIHIEKGLVKYALNRNDQHSHFYCHSCQKTFCLTEFSHQSNIRLDGYQIEHIETIIKGTCKNCLTS